MTNVYTILKHINTPTCMFCGETYKLRNELVFHIAHCKVFAEASIDIGKLQLDVSLAWQRAEDAERKLQIANETIATLHEKIYTLTQDETKDETAT